MKLFISEIGIKFIKSFESYSSQIYICPAGYRTIGYGHLLKDDEKFQHLTKAEAEDLLEHDLFSAQIAVLRLIHNDLEQHQFDMLVSFTFNLGAGALQRSTLRSKFNRGEDIFVQKEFERWIYAKGRIIPGLGRRRRSEAQIYLGGYNV